MNTSSSTPSMLLRSRTIDWVGTISCQMLVTPPDLAVLRQEPGMRTVMTSHRFSRRMCIHTNATITCNEATLWCCTKQHLSKQTLSPVSSPHGATVIKQNYFSTCDLPLIATPREELNPFLLKGLRYHHDSHAHTRWIQSCKLELLQIIPQQNPVQKVVCTGYIAT